MVPRVNGTPVPSQPLGWRPRLLGTLRIAMLTHYWAPEVGAPQTRLRETAQELMRLGDEVRVITNHPHYPDGRVRATHNALSIRRETLDGIRVLRLPVLARPNTGFLNRNVDQASFAAVAATAVGEVRWADVLLVESPPLFLGLTARWLSAVARRPYVFHVADPWPDYPIEVGAIRGAVPIWLARWLERTAYAGASAITTPTEGCARIISEQPGTHGKVHVVPNGVDILRFDPARSVVQARADLGWDQEPFTFVYSGSVGLAQGLATLLAAAAELQLIKPDRSNVIRIVGGGIERRQLKSEAERLGLRNVRFHPPVPASLVPTVLAAADAALVLLRSGRMADAALPTKLVEALAAARPVIASADGDVRALVEEEAAGWAVRAEDPAALGRAMADAMSQESLNGFGASGRRVAESRFDRSATVRAIRAVLQLAARQGISPVGP
jgi:glycosyltransferase involved in cell wall biosynthesis